jgi:hypothetical protein
LLAKKPALFSVHFARFFGPNRCIAAQATDSAYLIFGKRMPVSRRDRAGSNASSSTMLLRIGRAT